MTLTYHSTRLSNGLRLVVAPMAHVYSVTVAVLIGAGSRYETPKEAGSAHLLEHMLFKGSERRPTAQEISETVESTGGSLNASTDKDVTAYSARLTAGDVSLALDLLSDMVLHSTLDKDELRKEKRIVAEELGMAMDSPQEWVHTLIEEITWPGDPLGRDVAGTRESVAALTRAALRGYQKRCYAPSSTVVSVAGAVDPDAVLRDVEKWFGKWTGGLPPTHPTAVYGGAGGPAVTFQARETDQANLCLALPGVSRHDPRRTAFDLLNTVLGGGMSSRLFVAVREQQGLVYDIHSYGERYDDAGSLVVYAGMAPELGRQVVKEIIAQTRRLRDEPLSDDELRKLKRGYRGRMVLGLEDTASVADWCGGQELLYNKIDDPETVLEKIERVEAADIQSVATDLFHDAALRLAVIGPYDDHEKEEFADLLHY